MPFLAGALVVLSLLGSTLDWKPARPDYAWSFPRDHWARTGFRTEWWYFTGHLQTGGETPRRFGYQFTFFRVGLQPTSPALDSAWKVRDVIMGHAAVTDLTSKRHRFTEILYRAMPLLGEFGDGSGPLVAWSRPPAGSTGRWSLHWNGGGFDLAASDEGQDFSFRLTTRGTKGPIFQGPNGYSIKGGEDGAASQYYSFTRMATRGRVSIGGEVHAVEGVSWMDKEFGSNQLGARQIGWDWFSLQLDDGRDLMLYLLRDRHDQVDFANGTLISREGQARYLESGDWSVRATGTWTSPHNGARYPAGWRVRIPEDDLALVVTPEVPDSENVSRLLPGLAYWEGPVRVETVTGDRLGQGYVELTGYAERSRPAL